MCDTEPASRNNALWIEAIDALTRGDPLPVIKMLYSPIDLPEGFRHALASLLDPRPMMAGNRPWGEFVLKIAKVDRRTTRRATPKHARAVALLLRHIQAGATFDQAAKVVEDAGILSERQAYNIRNTAAFRFARYEANLWSVHLYASVMAREIRCGKSESDARIAAQAACEREKQRRNANYVKLIQAAERDGVSADKAIP